ncbi:DUF6457 domain-containing protein [Leifsonia shinshuensis]|uniref:DUF6457 domain-containing protein n=1 Tax=Leifsonia shinshuensis TaxID=150026 RepID=A0A7G6Y8X6_9MICO|nr:DUF6457 domain-containing protein [Leifsonia shinshuensis]QNE34941.1 hypothetical protein F1C12_07215 [Leifsonia shinshuensis]
MEPQELDAWAGAAARRLGVSLEPGDVSALLDLARDAAHGVTRPAAPLTAYIAGMAVGSGRTLEDVARELRVAIAEAAPGDGD